MLQSSFFGGPRGKDFLVSKILNNAAEAKADLDLGTSSDIRVDDYILISYGVLSDEEDSDYQNNLEADKNPNNGNKVNYNAKVYQKVIKNDSISSNNDNILSLKNDNNYAYKFIIDLSTELRISFTTDGNEGDGYNLTYSENEKTYVLNMPKPSISYEEGKLTIKLNGKAFETDVITQITDNSSNIQIPSENKLFFQIEEKSTFDEDFKLAINNESFNIGEWYLIECEYGIDDDISYWTVFAYAYATGTGKDCIVYSKVSGNASSSSSDELPEYIVNDGVMVKNDIKKQKTFIENSSGLIYTGNIDGEKIVLPGQIVYKDIIDDDNKKYYWPLVQNNESNKLYYEPSPLEKKLYDEIEQIKISQQQQPQEVVLKNTEVIGRRAISWFPDGSVSAWANADILNFYSRTSSTSSTYDVFSSNNTSNYINEKYLEAYAGTSNLYDLTNGLKYNINDLKDYDKIILTFKYQPKNITTEFYMSLININNVSKNRLITLNLSNGFKEFNLIFKKRQDGNFYLSYSDLQDSWKTTFYYDTVLTDDEYSSASSIDKLNPFFVQDSYIYLSLSTSSGATQRAYNSYYKNFTDYFNSLSVTLKGYKD